MVSQETRIIKGTRKQLEVLDMFTTLIMVMASCMYTYIRIYQIVHFKYVQCVSYTLTALFCFGLFFL